MAVPEDSAAVHADTRLRSLLARARQLKPETAIEPPLPTSDFSGDLGLPTPASTTRAHYFAAVEDAARHVYQSRAAATDIAAPAFIEIWDLFDILSVCGDQEQCDPALAWWLVEELLETQSIDGCRIVFDYLESRRERLVGQLFEKKNLIILRAFNELLRRLSRAEEAVFCGRVFVFLFQSFPLGARSSVNLKGDFHKENLTVFEEATEAVEEKTSGEDEAMTGVETTEVKDGETKNEDKTEEKTDEKPQETPDLKARLLADESVLYPAFWTMQQAFSNPPDYFFKLNKLDEFKVTLEATLAKFKGVPKVNQAAADHRGVKRSADELEDAEDEFTSTFNPKYLTSRELFALEVILSARLRDGEANLYS
jgi:THO complex subunit 1